MNDLTDEKTGMHWLRRNPWIWVVLVFVYLIAAWTILITIAVRNQPEKIPAGFNVSSLRSARETEASP